MSVALKKSTSPANLDDEGDVQVGLRAAVVEHLVALAGNAYKFEKFQPCFLRDWRGFSMQTLLHLV